MEKRNKNMAFHYMYRDGSNWKRHGEVVFTGEPEDYDNYEKELRKCFEDNDNFMADQIDVPERFGWNGGDEDDHCWHEFVAVPETSSDPDDERTPQEFLECVRKAGKDWITFTITRTYK